MTDPLSVLHRAPPALSEQDSWARLCCEQAILAWQQGCYAVGAVLVDDQQQLVCEGRNQVFEQGYHSDRHAEMQLLALLENEHCELNRRALTLYVTLEPCLMCYGRILLSGIGRVRYLVADREGGFTRQQRHLPPAWKDLASGLIVEKASVQPFWQQLAADLIQHYQSRQQLRERVVQAWQGR